ncbi:MAG: chloride channel protein [Bacteroidia bacterium]
MRKLRKTIKEFLASPDYEVIRDRVKSLRFPLTKEQADRFLFQFLKWRIKYVSNRNFLVVLSVLVGIICAIAAVILKGMVHYIEAYLQDGLNFPYKGTLYFIFPIIGILLTVWFVKRFLDGHLGRGISPILFIISRKGSKVEKHKTWSHLVTSAITAGFGGSAGLEAPIVVSGSAIGSNLGQMLHLNYRERTLLLGCGAAAGIAAVFNCPIAGVIFAFEVLLEGFTIPAFIPLLISAATAAVVSRVLYSGQLFYLITDGYQMSSLPFYILLGILCGMISAYMTRMTLRIEGKFEVFTKQLPKALVGGSMLGFLIFMMPSLYGEGYTTIQQLFNGNHSNLTASFIFSDISDNSWIVLGAGVAIIFLKVIATSLTLGAGGNGGIFAPSLFTGSILGYTMSFGVNQTSFIQLPTANFVACGMAGILSGVVHAPLTAIFLIAEITGGYSLFVPLMIVSATSYFIARIFEPYSVYTTRLAKKGMWFQQNRDYSVLRSMRLRAFIRKHNESLTTNMNLEQLIDVVSHSHRDIFPVLGVDNRLIGVIYMDDIREVLFNKEQYPNLSVKELMKKPRATVDVKDSMPSVMECFEKTHEDVLPVTEQGVFKGVVLKSDVFTGYRNNLIRQAQELS